MSKKISTSKMNMKTNQTFPTDSFLLAAYLLTESCRLITLDKANPRRAVFVFEESEKRQLLTEKFLSHETQVEPHKFFSAQKDLKQMLYNDSY